MLPPLTRIPNAVDADRFTKRTKEPRVLVATRLNEGKGVHHVIEALAATSGAQHELDIAGEGPQRTALERLARERQVPARFHGWLARSRLDTMFERSRIFVLASAAENFPVSLLEAMAARCAIVATRVGGIPEMVGDTALLVEPDDVRGTDRSAPHADAESVPCRRPGRACRPASPHPLRVVWDRDRARGRLSLGRRTPPEMTLPEQIHLAVIGCGRVFERFHLPALAARRP